MTESALSDSNPAPAPKRFFAWLGLAALLVLLDQASMQWIIQSMAFGDGFDVTGVFNIVRVHNHGAAFSFLAGEDGWQRWFFAGIAVMAAVWLTWMLKQHHAERLLATSLACVLGGALGNLIDRIQHGYVVDFLDFHWSVLAPVFYNGHFPAFNVADSAITIGACLLIYDEIRRWRKTRQA